MNRWEDLDDEYAVFPDFEPIERGQRHMGDDPSKDAARKGKAKKSRKLARDLKEFKPTYDEEPNE